MNIRGAQSGKDGVRILNTLSSIRPIAHIDVSVKYQIGRTTLEAGQSILAFEVFSAAFRIGVKFIVFSTNNGF